MQNLYHLQRCKELRPIQRLKSLKINSLTEQTINRRHSCEGDIDGFYGKKVKSMIETGNYTIRQHNRLKVLRRFRKYVHAVILIHVYYKKYLPIRQRSRKLTRKSTIKTRSSADRSTRLILLSFNHEKPVIEPSLNRRIKTESTHKQDPTSFLSNMYRIRGMNNTTPIQKRELKPELPKIKKQSLPYLINLNSRCKNNTVVYHPTRCLKL